MRKKEWFYKTAACIASAALIMTALPVISASAATSVKELHMSHSLVNMTLKSRLAWRIRRSAAFGRRKNYAGNYVSDNQLRPEMAAEVLKKWTCKSTADAKEISAVDVVSNIFFESDPGCYFRCTGSGAGTGRECPSDGKIKRRHLYSVTISYYTDKARSNTA